MIPINPRQHFDAIIQPPGRFRRLLSDVIPIIERFVPQKRHKAQSQPNDHKINPERCLPWLKVRNDGGEKRAKVGRDDERPCPNANFPCVFMEEEHVVDKAETNHLRCRGEEALETPGDDVGDPSGGEDGEECHPEGHEHCPPKYRDTTESLGKGNGHETTDAKHLQLRMCGRGSYKDVAGKRATGVIGGNAPINRLRDDQGNAPRGSQIGDDRTKGNHKQDLMLLCP